MNILLLGTTFSARKIGLEFKIYTQRNSSLRTVLKAAKEFSFRKSRLNVERLFSYESDTKSLTTFESSYNDNTKPKAIDMLRHLFRLAMAGLKSSLIGHLTPRNSMSSFLAVEWIISSPIAQIKKDFSSPTTIFVCSCTQTKVFSIFLRYLSSITWTSYWICSWKRSKIRTINQSFSMHV